MTEQAPTRQRRGRRRGEDRSADDGPTKRQQSYRHLVNPFPPVRLFSDDQVEAIHRTALKVLQELGIKMLLPEARELVTAAGAVERDDEVVCFDEGMVQQALDSAPSSIALAGAQPETEVVFGGKNVIFAPVAGPPHASDLEGGRRPGTLADYENFVRLAESFDVLHVLTPCVEPQDVPVNLRHLAFSSAQLRLSRKPPFIYARGSGQIGDSFEAIRLARGLDRAAFEARPWTYTVINTNSPRQLDRPMLGGILDMARAGQISIITPFTLAGAMAPITIPGALVQQHAEFLAGLVVAQTVKAGAPVVYGAFTSNVDMKTGAPAFGTPEYVHAAFGTGQLARHLNLPWRSSVANAANGVDAQAAYESQMSLWSAVFGGANIFLHSAGWLEGGLTASFEKFIVDVEALQMMAEVMQPRSLDAGELAFDAIAEVETGGHYFGATHTMSRYQEAFYEPLVSDWSNHGTWLEQGSQSTAQRANATLRATLERFEPPQLDPDRAEALADFVARRTSEGGAPIE
ncbi:MAG: trimethylamine methyltransferase family protein [Rhodospirillales bacterium]